MPRSRPVLGGGFAPTPIRVWSFLNTQLELQSQTTANRHRFVFAETQSGELPPKSLSQTAMPQLARTFRLPNSQEHASLSIYFRSSSHCVVNRPLVMTPIWAGMRTKWSPGPGINVQSVVSSDEGKWVVSACGPASGICPECRHQTRSRRGWSYRSLQDLPIQGNVLS